MANVDSSVRAVAMRGRGKDFNKGEIIKNLTLWPKLKKIYLGNNSKTLADNITFTFYLKRLWDPQFIIDSAFKTFWDPFVCTWVGYKFLLQFLTQTVQCQHSVY